MTDENRAKNAALSAAQKPDSVKFSIVEQDANEALKKIIEIVKETKPLLYSALHSCSIKPTPEGLMIIASNSIQQGQIKTDEGIVLKLLREALKLEGIGMTIHVDPEQANKEVERRPYSAGERFEYLAKKNPLLRKLRDDFQFDIS